MSSLLVIRGAPSVTWVYDTTDNSLLARYDLPAGSTEGVNADALETQYPAADGTVYMGVLPAAGAPVHIKKVNPLTGETLQAIALTGITLFTTRYSLAQALDGTFLATTSIGGTSSLKRFSAAGATLQTYGAPETDMLCFGISRDRTVAYYSRTADLLLRRWDLVNDVALPTFGDLTLGGATLTWSKTFIVLPDNGILALFPTNVVQFAPDGAQGITYLPINALSIVPVGAAYDPSTRRVYVTLAPVAGVVAGSYSTFNLGIATQISTTDVPLYLANTVSRATLTPPYGAPRAYPVGATTAEPIRRLRQPPTLQHDRFRTFYDRFTLDVQSGGALSDGTAVAQIALSFSDDGGHTWSQPEWISAGGVGEYDKQVVWTRLGSAITRIWRVEMTSAVPVAWLQAILDISPGAQ